MSLDSGYIPTDWKAVCVSYIFKKGDSKIAGNYRLESLTYFTCKLLEHIISSSIMCHLEGNDILYRLQHGFHKYKSCETHLISLFNMHSGASPYLGAVAWVTKFRMPMVFPTPLPRVI